MVQRDTGDEEFFSLIFSRKISIIISKLVEF